VQGFPHWSPPTGALGELVASSRLRGEGLELAMSRFDELVATRSAPPSLRAALRGDRVAVIGEVKRSSPSKGAINLALDSAEQAMRYAEGGAAALSILTEPTRFGGSNEDVERVRGAVALPVLKKDFHVHPTQIGEAVLLGASAVLLIVRAVSPADFRTLMGAAGDAGLEVLVEIRDEAELALALAAGATMVGVNNRNLETLVIDPATSERLIPLIPPGVIAVAESGVSSPADVRRYADVGADAVLVGSSISAAADPAAAVRALAAVPRQARGV
jgi:indole-3-glycerol phosphate synthase